MNIDWNEIEHSIVEYYREIELEISQKELEYLKTAFFFTEKLWKNQYEKIDKINYVMISEAPLFGGSENYFYNPNTNFSSFFYFKNIEAFDITYTNKDYNNKEFVLSVLNKNGFLILDIFPFALNKNNTQINYNSLNKKQYQKLLQFVVQIYLNKKLVLINSKCTDGAVFVYRYKRLKEKLSRILENELVKFNLIQKGADLDTLNNNMSLDKEKLKKIINNSRVK